MLAGILFKYGPIDVNTGVLTSIGVSAALIRGSSGLLRQNMIDIACVGLLVILPCADIFAAAIGVPTARSDGMVRLVWGLEASLLIALSRFCVADLVSHESVD